MCEFSVIIPAYNCESTIESVLDSVKNQTRVDLIREVIIIDDGSTDKTGDKIIAYSKKNPLLNIHFISQENHGVSYTRNRGIKLATAEWIALLDSDDIWLPNKIERQNTVIADNQDVCFLGSSYPVKFFFKTYRSGLVKLTPQQLCIRYMPSTPSVVFKKSIGIELGLFDENESFCEDILFFQKFFLKDSYYILAEDLIKISIGKKFFNQTGLSSNLIEMRNGRERNIKELYEMSLISKSFYFLMILFSRLKYARRVIIMSLSKLRFRRNSMK